MKKYNNYAEQTADNITITGTYEGETCVLWDEIYNIKDNLTTDESIIPHLNANVVDMSALEFDGAEWYELRSEAIWEAMQGIYILYTVDLKGNEYTGEHERLEIVWCDEANSYVMPCYAFGMPWNMVAASN